MATEDGVKRTPSDFLKAVLGRPVNVKLNNGVEYRGILACLDGYMNIAMEQTKEYVNGQLSTQYGDCFIRGNNGKTELVVHSRRVCHQYLCSIVYFCSQSIVVVAVIEKLKSHAIDDFMKI